MKEVPPFKGTFSPGSETLPRLLMYLHTSGRTGTLCISSGGLAKKLYMKQGEAVFASSSSKDDWLGVALVKAGKITLQQFEYSTEILQKGGKRHGAVLVELGYITPKELFWAVKFQVREIIYSMFEYDRADYEFVEGDIPEEVITLMMSMGSLIYEGVGRIDNLIRIKEELPSAWTVLQLNDDPMRLFQGVQFSAKDKRILSFVDGKRTVKQVIEDSCLNSFESMKIVYVFWAIGILTEKKSDNGNISADVLFLKPYDDPRDEFEARVASMHERLRQPGPRELLGVSETADLQEIKDSYYRLAREFHPDRVFDSEDQHLRDKLVEIFNAVKNAYLSLSSPLEAAEDAVPIGPDKPAGPPGPIEEETVTLVNAQEEWGPEAPAVEPDSPEPVVPEAPGESPEPAGLAEPVNTAQEWPEDLADAPAIPVGIDALREAVRLDPSDPAGWRRLALALIEDGGFFEEAEGAMLEAIGLDPLESDCYLELGLVYLEEQKIHDAIRQFEKSLVLDPENRKAREQLERLGE